MLQIILTLLATGSGEEDGFPRWDSMILQDLQPYIW